MDSIWVVVGSYELMVLILRIRVVNAVVCEARRSQDENRGPVERWRYHSLGKRQRRKKLEASTSRKTMNSILVDR